MIQIRCDKCGNEFAITRKKCPNCGDKVKIESKFLCGDCEEEIDVNKGICSHCNKRPKEIIIVSSSGKRVKTEFETEDQNDIVSDIKKEQVEVEENIINNDINQSYRIFSIVALIYIITVRLLAIIANRSTITQLQQTLSSHIYLAFIVITILPITLLIIGIYTNDNKTKYILGIVTSIILIFSTSIIGNIVFILYLIDSIRYLITENKKKSE